MSFYRQLSQSGGNSSVFTVDTTQVSIALREYARELSLPETPRQVLSVGADVVTKSVRKLSSPKSRKKHYYYRKGKKVEIKPGNLLKSTRKFFTRLKEYEVGPKVLRKLPEALGATVNTSSGYYASALYGKAATYRRRVLEPQLANPTVLRSIIVAFAKWHKKQKAAK